MQTNQTKYLLLQLLLIQYDLQSKPNIEQHMWQVLPDLQRAIDLTPVLISSRLFGGCWISCQACSPYTTVCTCKIVLVSFTHHLIDSLIELLYFSLIVLLVSSLRKTRVNSLSLISLENSPKSHG